MHRIQRWYDAARRTPSAVLMVVQLGGIVVYPFLDDRSGGRAVFGLIGLLVLALAVAAVRMTSTLLWVSVLLGVPTAALTVAEVLLPGNDPVLVVSSVAHAVFYFYTTFALVKYMFADEVATRDEVWATGATFTVLAWGFAYLFTAVQVLDPGAFTAAVDPEAQRTWVELLFLSVTTLSSTGLSDVVPVTPHGRSVVMLEQIAGMLYLALVVARVTALTVAKLHARP